MVPSRQWYFSTNYMVLHPKRELQNNSIVDTSILFAEILMGSLSVLTEIQIKHVLLDGQSDSVLNVL
jgi:hypothetical protein